MIRFSLLTFSINAKKMNSPTTHFIAPRKMDVYEALQQIDPWADFKNHGYADTSAYATPDFDTETDNQSEKVLHGSLEPANKYDREATKCSYKVQRRLAQNREAARKSRLRKKAYVQQLETSRLKLIQLEQELQLSRRQRQGAYIGGGLPGGHLEFSRTISPGISKFMMEYGRWVEEQNRQICELRNALNGNKSDTELQTLVEAGMGHYFRLFHMKSTAAKDDVFYLISGIWETPAEQFYSWIGGFRPSEILKVLMPLRETLTEQQLGDICGLEISCQQVEDALSRGMEKLQQLLSETVAFGQLGEGSDIPQMDEAMEKLEALVSFVGQADHIRRETLCQITHIFTVRQAALALLIMGEYFQRLRTLSSIWSTRPHEPTSTPQVP